MTNSSSRREFLRLSAGFSALGAGAPLALQFAAAGSAAAQTASDYRALICIFMQGGQDSNNMVLATDTDSWGRYTSARNTGAAPIALPPPGALPVAVPPGTRKTRPEHWGGVLPIVPRTPQPIPPGTNATNRTFALHPMLAPVVPLFQQNRLAVLANVGMLVQPTTKAQYRARSVPLPGQLFSHNDQQSSWQSGATEGAQNGWGGRIADMVAGMNGDRTVFTAISADGNAVFLAGDQVTQYAVNNDGAPGVSINNISGGAIFGSNAASTALNNIIRSTTGVSNLSKDYADVVVRSIGAATTINGAVGSAASAAVARPPAHVNPIDGQTYRNVLTEQLFTVLKLIAAAPTLGVRRQVFFVQLGNFDTHQNQNLNEPDNLSKVAEALVYLDAQLASMGGVDMRSRVTAFTASDFSRTFTTNGSGTDHAWGGHHFIWGGAVNGGDIYGQYPTLGIDRPGFYNPDIDENNMIPTTSVDQYGATLARWFGVGNTDLTTIFPRLGNFPAGLPAFLQGV